MQLIAQKDLQECTQKLYFSGAAEFGNFGLSVIYFSRAAFVHPCMHIFPSAYRL